MRSFCLNPTWSLFKKICEDKKNLKKPHFPIWRAACVVKYLEKWSKKPGFPESNKFSNKSDEYLTFYKEEGENILREIERKPTDALINKLWYMFYATGEVGFIQKAFEVCGYEASETIRKIAMSTFDESKRFYFMEIAKLNKSGKTINDISFDDDGNYILPKEFLEYSKQYDDVELGKSVCDAIASFVVFERLLNKIKLEQNMISDVNESNENDIMTADDALKFLQDNPIFTKEVENANNNNNEEKNDDMPEDLKEVESVFNEVANDLFPKITKK